MNQEERLDYLIRKLCTESGEYQNIKVPQGLMQERPRLLRSLMNVRMPKPIDTEFLKIQDEYLKEEALAKGIVTLSDIPTIEKQYKSKSKYPTNFLSGREILQGFLLTVLSMRQIPGCSDALSPAMGVLIMPSTALRESS